MRGRNKTNKKFMLLSAIGIFMVVDHHTFTAFNLFGTYIPYNSFFMPMFVFISGYFNKVDDKTKLSSYIGRKAKNLLIPYAGISLLVFILQQLINLFKSGELYAYPSGYLAYVLERILTVGSFAAIAEPMWFVIALFAALLVYALLKKLLNKIWNSYIMFAIFCLLQFRVVYMAQNMDPELLNRFLLPLKVLFFLPFLELGIIYREHLEKKHSELPGGVKIAVMFLMLVINAIRTIYLPNPYDLAFDSINDLSGFTSPYFVTPLISSIIGITFWLTMVELISKALAESSFVNYLSCNTFWIMGLHIVFFNILNCVLMIINEHIILLPYFDTAYFSESEWYYWEPCPAFKCVYVIFGILGPLACKRLYDLLCSSFLKRKNVKPTDEV